MYEVGQWAAVKFSKQWNSGGVVDTYNNKIDIRCMGIIGENIFAWIMFAGRKIVILSAILSYQLLFLRKYLDCVQKTLKK